MVWNESEISILINERKLRNEEYWLTPGRDRTAFWDSIAAKINIEYQTAYTSKQCQEKFQNLVRDYTVRENLIFIK